MAQITQALELKGRMLATTRIRVVKADTQAIARDLATLAEKMPLALKGMAALIEAEAPFDLGLFVKQLKAYGIQPLGVCGPELAELAAKLGLPVLPKESGRNGGGGAVLELGDDAPITGPRAEAGAGAAAVEKAVATAPAAPTPPAVHLPARIVTEPVRSGQQVYAAGCDLVVMSAVSPGAEVIADGCIHIYGPLRGRALAGAVGDTSARIFASRFEAELVAVGGVFSLTEQVKSALRGVAAQVLLREGQLVIETLG